MRSDPSRDRRPGSAERPEKAKFSGLDEGLAKRRLSALNGARKLIIAEGRARNADNGILRAPAEGFGLSPSHPGAILRDELAARGLTANALALKLDNPANRRTEILNGERGVSPKTALRLSSSAAFWLGLQRRCDLAQAQARTGARVLAQVETAAEPSATIDPCVS